MIKPFKNFGIKMIALFSAICLWFVVITVENTVFKYTEKVDLKVINMSKNMVLETDLQPVDVYLRVNKEDLKKILKSEIELTIDLNGANAGEITVPITSVSKSAFAQILKTDPVEVKIKLSEIVEKEIDVLLKIEGEPKSGYFIENTTLKTKKVKIKGAESVIENINSVEAVLVLDGTQTNNKNYTLNLFVPNNFGKENQNLLIEPSEVVVDIEINKKEIEKELILKPKFISEKDRDVYESRIEIEPSKIKVSGSEDILQNIETIETTPIEMSFLIRKGSIESDVELKEGMKILNPTKITIKLKESKRDEGPTI